MLMFCPSGGQFPKMVCDQWTVMYIKKSWEEDKGEGEEEEQEEEVKGPPAEEVPPENIEMCYSFEECVILQQSYKHVMVVLSTHNRPYLTLTLILTLSLTLMLTPQPRTIGCASTTQTISSGCATKRRTTRTSLSRFPKWQSRYL